MRYRIREENAYLLERPCEWCGLPLMTENVQRRFCDEHNRGHHEFRPYYPRLLAADSLRNLRRAAEKIERRFGDQTVLEVDGLVGEVRALALQQASEDHYRATSGSVELPAWLTEDYEQ